MPRLKALALHLSALAAFTALSILHTWPLVAKLSGHVVGGREDVYMNMWHLWWMRQALWVEPQNPYFASLLHWPLGAEMYWHTLAPAKTALGVLLLSWMRIEVAYNLLVLGSFVLTGYTTWLLLRHLLLRAGHAPALSAAAALVGACVFDFSRYHLCQGVSHLNLVALEGLPLYLLFFFRWLDEGRRRWLFGVGASALYVLACDYYYFLYLALFSFLWVAAERWRRGPLLSLEVLKDPTIRRAGIAAAVAGLVCLPPIVPLLLHLKPAPLPLHHGDSDYFADLALFVLPDPQSALLPLMPAVIRSFSTGVAAAKMAGNLEEAGIFLGWATLALAGFGLWKGVPDGRRWLGIGLIFSVLSLGTVLAVFGDERHGPGLILLVVSLALLANRGLRAKPWSRDLFALLAYATVMAFALKITAFGQPLRVQLPMPYVLFKHVVPLFSQGGMPVRFELVTTLALAVMAAFGAAHAGRWASQRGAWVGVLGALALAVVPNVEYWGRPFPMPRLSPTPPVFEEIRQSPWPSAVFTDHVIGQWEQTVHGKPVSFARLSRLPVREAEMLHSRLYRALGELRGAVGPVSAEEKAQMLSYLKQHGFRWYVSHAFHPVRHQFVTEVLEGTLVHRGDGLAVYRFNWN